MGAPLRLIALKLATVSELQRDTVLANFTVFERKQLRQLIGEAQQLPIVAYPELLKALDIPERSVDGVAEKTDFAAIVAAPAIWQQYASATLSEFDQQLLQLPGVRQMSDGNLPPMLCSAVASALAEIHVSLPTSVRVK